MNAAQGQELYRLFDAADRLLYVGISLNGARRASEHREKHWWPEVARIAVERYPTRHAARNAEQEVIVNEKPKYNIKSRRISATTAEERARNAARSRRYRNRQRGGPPRTLSDDPLARAKRRMRKGSTVAELDPVERDALRAYHAERQRARRNPSNT